MNLYKYLNERKAAKEKPSANEDKMDETEEYKKLKWISLSALSALIVKRLKWLNDVALRASPPGWR